MLAQYLPFFRCFVAIVTASFQKKSELIIKRKHVGILLTVKACEPKLQDKKFRLYVDVPQKNYRKLRFPRH